ncbi:MAG: SMC-Scp complex subunit ScpB [Gammaproteobacteria bacterium]|nr:MAG: SMC-Scp complex subunit ScpB [Gammaproteobacteria bacterium]
MSSHTEDRIECLLEAAILASDQPVSLERLCTILFRDDSVDRRQIKEALERLQVRYQDRGIQLNHVASGYRFQVNQKLAPDLARLWETRPPRYSRALLETLSIIAYKQPITRGEVERIRGVSVSGSIMRTLLDHEWIKVVGHRDVPGRPALYGTTKMFLDYFNLRSLSELPALPDVGLNHQDIMETQIEEQEVGDNPAAGQDMSVKTDSSHESVMTETHANQNHDSIH